MLPLDDEWGIFLAVNPDYGLKKVPGRLDALVNAYKVPADRLKDATRFIGME